VDQVVYGDVQRCAGLGVLIPNKVPIMHDAVTARSTISFGCSRSLLTDKLSPRAHIGWLWLPQSTQGCQYLSCQGLRASPAARRVRLRHRDRKCIWDLFQQGDAK
jgi:hypothetical protein